MLRRLRSVVEWLIRRPGYMLLAADDDRLAAEPARRFERAWIELMLVSALIGAALIGVWGAAWKINKIPGVPVLQAGATMAAMLLWPFRRAAGALSKFLDGRDGATRGVAAAVLAGLLTMCLIALRPDWELPESGFNWMHPKTKLYRVLFLMPLWGGWSMLIVPRFCRLTERTESAVAALARGCGPLLAACCLAAVLAATILYFNFMPWTQLGISGAAILAAVAGGPVLCRKTGGLNRSVLLATNLLTQLVFLIAYLVTRSLAIWWH